MGLLLLRLVAGGALLARGAADALTAANIGSTVLHLLAILCGTTLIVGLWTPFSGSAAGILAIWNAFSQQGDSLACILLAAIGAALALLGPGAWSVDARLFGWKRIDVRDRSR